MKLARIPSLIAMFPLSVCLGAGAALALHFVSSLDMDRSIRPGDDFYRYANGSWLRNIPADRQSYDTRTMLTEKTSQRVRELIEAAAADKAAPGSLKQKVGDYYASFLDEKSIYAKGWKPLDSERARIAAVSNKKQLADYLGGTLNSEVDGLTSNADHIFGVWVNQSFTDSKHYVFHLLQGGLGMPDRDSYLDPSAKTAELRLKYVAHIADILKLAGIADAERKAGRILALEVLIAQSHAPDSDSADVFKQNNPWKRTEFAAKAPGMDWTAYFTAAGVNQQKEFIVWQPSAVTGTAALVGSEGLDVWKDYLEFHLIEHYANVLPGEVAAEDFAFYGKALSGQTQPKERAASAIAATNAALGQAVGQLYTRRYFPPAAKAAARAMVSNLVVAYRGRIENLNWMSPQTKAKALRKLAALNIGVGYPEKWTDYSTLHIVRGDAFGNTWRAEAFNRALNLKKLRQVADPGEWRIDPQMVGAVILFTPNTETFSAGILQPPYFDANGDAASNYGSAGAGIAHEISHSFDELGNIYDDQGRLSKWWTAEDENRYRAAASKFAEQLNADCPFPDACVNGKQVANESVADLAGLSVAHDAYILSLKGKEDTTIDGFTGEQRFFLAFAQRWRKFQSEAALRHQLATDIHLPAEFRSDAVRNADAWYKAFEVAPGDKLYLKAEARSGIW